ncbi:MAG TPA: hypothetical protein PKA98_00020 [Acidimicrobiales bacterium]|nr:hypothetical protein [Acidimicrobiales bacterium]
MSPTARLLARLLLPALSVVAVMAAPAASRITSLVRAGNGDGNRQPVEVTIDGSGYGSEVVMVQDSDRVAVFSGASFRVPIGVPTLFAAFDEAESKVTRLGITTGASGRVRMSPRSAAASLVALSPGVLTTDDAWLGVVGHIVESPTFPELVTAVDRSTTLSDPQVHAALRDVLKAVPPVNSQRCTSVCGEWLAESPDIVMENALRTRAVVRPSDPSSDRFCGSAAPLAFEFDPVAVRVGDAAVAGTSLDANLKRPMVGVPSLTLLEGAEVCGRNLTVGTSTAAGQIDETARWLTLLAEYAAPLVDLIAGDEVSPRVDSLEQLAVRRSEESGKPSVEDALRLVLDEVEGLSTVQRSTVLAVGDAVGDGLFGQRTWPTSRDAILDGATDAATPASTSTTTSPPTAPPPTVPAAPPTTAPVIGGELLIRYQANQQPSSFMIEATARNTGEVPVDLTATTWRLVDSSTGATLVPTTVPASLQVGSLAPGSSTSGTLRFTLVKPPAAYKLSWGITPSLNVEAEL